MDDDVLITTRQDYSPWLLKHSCCNSHNKSNRMFNDTHYIRDIKIHHGDIELYKYPMNDEPNKFMEKIIKQYKDDGCIINTSFAEVNPLNTSFRSCYTVDDNTFGCSTEYGHLKEIVYDIFGKQEFISHICIGVYPFNENQRFPFCINRNKKKCVYLAKTTDYYWVIESDI
uniref:Uncharacterized protein n=1 Tax=viral metagenome TaxID=1070528 RepID=A0A6C0J459_9ZZZZ